ncbi:MAG: sulfatase-like hydrolase/transferase [Planctomycetota bacterium]
MPLTPPAPRSGPPNILFLMSDEHRADLAGFGGNDVVRTPVLDELARTGVVFDNAYCPSPVCVPCRQAMAAGQRPRTCGVEQFCEDLPPNSMTFARRLQQYGYETCCVGKLHHTGPDQMQGWTQRLGLDTHVGDAFRDLRVDPTTLGAGAWSDGKWSDAKEIRRAGVGKGPMTQVHDASAIDEALRYADVYFANAYYDRPVAPRPLLLKLSFTRPHYPYFADEALFTYYLNRVPVFEDEPLFDHPFLSQHAVTPGQDVTVRELRRATAAYYAMIEAMDLDYGRMMDRLTELGEDLDDWWIVYTSDHGEMLGEHGIWEKQKFFEGSARVPLVIRPPARLRDAWGCTGLRVQQNVNLIDLFATLCEAAEVPLPPPEECVRGRALDSRSLVPLMRGATETWDNETTSEYGGTNLMIRRDDLKYQWYDREDCRSQPTDLEVLFDLSRDPGERHNAADDPAYADTILAFRKRRDELGFASSM